VQNWDEHLAKLKKLLVLCRADDRPLSRRADAGAFFHSRLAGKPFSTVGSIYSRQTAREVCPPPSRRAVHRQGAAASPIVLKWRPATVAGRIAVAAPCASILEYKCLPEKRAKRIDVR